MFDRLLEFVLEREGGYADHPADPGGATNYGITQATYTAWLADQGRTSYPVRHITPAEVSAIYRERYFMPSRAYLLPYPLALVHFDAAVNQGVTQAIKFLQRSAGVDDDGAFGPITEAAIQAAIERGLTQTLSHEYLWQRLAHYRTISQRRPSLQTFLPGWIRRMEHLWTEVKAGS